MKSEQTDFDRITSQFAAHLKQNVNGDLILGTRSKEVRDGWKALEERARVGAKAKALVRVTYELENLHSELHRKFGKK
jgi:hypothetical protein